MCKTLFDKFSPIFWNVGKVFYCVENLESPRSSMSSRELFSSGLTRTPTTALICRHTVLSNIIHICFMDHRPLGSIRVQWNLSVSQWTNLYYQQIPQWSNIKIPTKSQWWSLIPGLQMVFRSGMCFLNWSILLLKYLDTRQGPGSSDRALVSVCIVPHITSNSLAIVSALRFRKGPGDKINKMHLIGVDAPSSQFEVFVGQ